MSISIGLSVTLTLIIVNTLLKYIPFIVFKSHTPSLVVYLGKVLPKAIMAMLVIYCLKDAILDVSGQYLMLVSSLIVVIIHLLFKNTLVSVGLGTIIYMILIHL